MRFGHNQAVAYTTFSIDFTAEPDTAVADDTKTDRPDLCLRRAKT